MPVLFYVEQLHIYVELARHLEAAGNGVLVRPVAPDIEPFEIVDDAHAAEAWRVMRRSVDPGRHDDMFLTPAQPDAPSPSDELLQATARDAARTRGHRHPKIHGHRRGRWCSCFLVVDRGLDGFGVIVDHGTLRAAARVYSAARAYVERDG